MKSVTGHLPLPPAAALQAAALRELDGAMVCLRRADARGVHQTRKSCKRLRAYSRLLRDLPLDVGVQAKQLNDLLRTAAKGLAEPREAAVAAETFAGLQCPGGVSSTDWRKLGHELRQQADKHREPGPKAIVTAGDALAKARELLAALPVGDLRRSDLRRGLRKNYKRARKAFRRTTPCDAVALHEWRKRAKRLEAIQGMLEPLLDKTAVPPKRLEQLTDLLGQHHDLHVLPLRPGLSTEQREWLVQAAAHPAAALERRVRRRGRALFQRRQ
jgi:hypothetical protein